MSDRSSVTNDFDFLGFDSGNSDCEIYDFDHTSLVFRDLMKMYREGSFNDVCIKLHDGEIKANKSILAARCEYFAAAFRWKSNNNPDVEEIVINDCSKKIMTRLIEYIFSGVLVAKGLNLLEFLELIDQGRKMFPGDLLGERLHDFLKDEDYIWTKLRIPTNEEVANAITLVESKNLQPEVLVDLARAIETLIIKGTKKDFEKNASALVNLLSCGVIETIQHLKLLKDLEFLSADQLQSLVSCVTERIDISNVTNCDVNTLLDHIECKELHLSLQKSNHEETFSGTALLRAMKSRVEILHLEFDGNRFHSVDLDSTLRRYKGDGKCKEIHIVKSPMYDLTSLLDSVNCKELHLYPDNRQTFNTPYILHRLNQKETEALVRAMTSRVEIVHLGSKWDDDVDGVCYKRIRLGFDILTKYKGDGKCREINCNYVCIGERESYPEEADDEDDWECDYKWIDLNTDSKTWAEMMNWDINFYCFNGYSCSLTRKNN